MILVVSMPSTPQGPDSPEACSPWCSAGPRGQPLTAAPALCSASLCAPLDPTPDPPSPRPRVLSKAASARPTSPAHCLCLTPSSRSLAPRGWGPGWGTVGQLVLLLSELAAWALSTTALCSWSGWKAPRALESWAGPCALHTAQPQAKCQVRGHWAGGRRAPVRGGVRTRLC